MRDESRDFSTPEMVQRLRVFSTVAGALVAAFGLIVLLGWIVGSDSLKGAWALGITAKTNAAIALLCLGIALVARVWARPKSPLARAGQGLALLAAAIGGATLSEHLFGWNLGIDELLFREPVGAAVTTSPNRMGPPASTCFVLFGIALILLDVRTKRVGAPFQALGIAGSILAFIPVLGFVFDARELFGIARLTGIALSTALALCLLGVGIVCARPEAGMMRQLVSNDSGGLLVRRQIVWAILLPIGLMWLVAAGEKAGLYGVDFGRSMFALGTIGLYSTLVWWTGGTVSRQTRSRLRAEAAEAEATRRLIQSLDSVSDAFLACDPQWRITHVNAAAERIYRLRREEVLGRDWWEVFAEHLPPSHARGFRRAMSERVPVRFESWSPGRERCIETGISPAAEGGLAVVVRDVTDQRLAAETLRENARELEEKVEARTRELRVSNEQLTDFSFSIAHDLRAPIRAVRGYLDTLLDELGAIPASAGEHAERIREATSRMDRLILSLLQYGRLGKMDLTLEPIDLSEVVAEAIENMQSEIHARGAVVDVVWPRELPRVLAHRAALVQVVVNLLGNGMKFVDDGVVPRLRVSAEAIEDRVRLLVDDNGIGIAREHHARIFNLFEQLHGRDRYPGTGIGLAMVKKSLERMDGAVGLESAPERGSTFWIELTRAGAPALPSDPVGNSTERRDTGRLAIPPEA